MPAPIAILFANLKGNLGDFALLEAALRDCSARFPGHPLHVYPHAHLPVDEERTAAFEAAGVPAFEVKGGTFFAPVWPRLKSFYRFGIWPHLQHRLVVKLEAASRTDAAKFAEYHAVVSVGGDHFNSMDLGIAMFATTGAVAEAEQRVAMYPFSVNSQVFDFNRQADLHRYFARLKQPPVVRDSITQGVLARMGIEAHLGADCVYSLHDHAGEIEPLAKRDASRILLVATEGTGRALEATLSAAVERLGDARPVELLTTCDPEDRPAFTAVAAKYGIAYRAPLTWQEMIAELKASSLVVTNRLHCLILGSIAECTLLPITDRQKSEAFARDSGVPHAIARLGDLDPARAQAVITDGAAQRSSVTAFRDTCRASTWSPFALDD
ncbi:MAG: polysaccharide pyruvyl transferase family protein [Alteraurantiacibacter sp.]